MSPNLRNLAPVAARRRRRVGFVLLEVLLSMTILAVSVAAFMRSFTQSLHAARTMEIQTQALFFAYQLMDEFEIFPPESDEETEGGFGDAYAAYSWWIDLRVVDPNYRLRDEPDQIEQFFAMRPYTLEIRYDDGTDRRSVRAVRVESAIIGFEKFSYQSKQSYANF